MTTPKRNGRSNTKRRTPKLPKAEQKPKQKKKPAPKPKKPPPSRRTTTRATPGTSTTPKATSARGARRAVPAAARTTAARTRSRAAIDVATLARTVAAELQRHGDGTPDDVVVATLATVAAGYRKGPGASPPWPMAIDLDARVAEGLVDVYWTGDRLPDPDRRELRATARTWAGYNLAQLGTGGSAKARNTLAAVGLGAWRPGEPKTKVKPLVDMVAGWYLAGLS